ncbi:hypothetical protein BGZ95_010917 [Linnemannia exigua]|uniref:FAD-binding domain-containing protein n=1 Tax=Linnemannia exigua TaxID=604196 RepID=A0AAD4DAM7_9FUNG|nr:hypothetical protein BGZ95_010917 [Linnemannia exigua]
MTIDPVTKSQHDPKVMVSKRPKVLIVGAGLGGLTLGAILQKTDIPYEIFERAPEMKPLGSAITFTPVIAPFWKQLGMYEEILAHSKEMTTMELRNENRGLEYELDFSEGIELCGAGTYVIPRPVLYDLLMRYVPREHIHFGRKILSTKQGNNGVMIQCSDGSEFEGDILVGADGAYSAVRKSMYEELSKISLLPPSDALPLTFSTVCLVGQTQAFNPSEFPDIASEKCKFMNILGESKPYSYSTFTTAQKTVCWAVIMYLDAESSKDNDAFRNSEWGPGAAAAMCEQVKDFPIVAGGDKKLTMGDLIERTPKELISKVMLEEKVFKTWHHCRTVLLGDACHKLSPAGGAGAANAMHDAVTLANQINALTFHPTINEITAAFKAYCNERQPWVQEAFDSSRIFKIMTSTSLMGKVVRFCTKHLPAWIQKQALIKMALNRPQIAFLPRSADKGSVKPAVQPSLQCVTPKEETVVLEQ